MAKATSAKFYGTGRRKSSIARVYLTAWYMAISQSIRETLTSISVLRHLKLIVRQPLVATETADKFDVLVNVHGGGYNRSGWCYPSRHLPEHFCKADAEYPSGTEEEQVS